MSAATPNPISGPPELPLARVFIGIPTYNRPRLVRETIASVATQTFTDFRVIVSDNCSAPETSAAVARFVEELGDPRIRFYRQPSNGGEYGQGRYFFSEAAGHEYFMILHDDDLLEPDYLERAIADLDAAPQAAFFVANPWLIDADGKVSAEDTERYARDHGRLAQPRGEFDVLSSHLAWGFTPISGTLFRYGALVRSGFVDADCHGNFPFEANIFLRLGEPGERAWFCPERRLRFRFHPQSLRVNLRLMENPQVVHTMARLFERRRFSGANERRRRVVLSRLYRAGALIAARQGEPGECRRLLWRALRCNPASLKAWAWAPACLLAPGLTARLLPPAEAAR